MLTPEKKIKLFVAAIDEDYKNRRNALIAEIDADAESALAKVKTDAEKLCHDMVASETEKIKEQSKRTVTERERELRLVRMKKRESIRLSVFDEARKSLTDFAASPEYDAYLKKCAEKAASAFPDTPVKVFVRPCDVSKGDMILPFFPEGSEICGDGTILIGGIRVLAEPLRTTADNTLDCALRQEEEVFYSSSGLTL